LTKERTFSIIPPLFLINGLRLDLLDDAEIVENDLNLEVAIRTGAFLDAGVPHFGGWKNVSASRALNDGDGKPDVGWH